MKTRVLPGTFAPRYQELHVGNTVKSATRFTYSTHASCASGVASIVAWSFAFRCATQSAIQSTCCWIDTSMLVSTEGLPGPLIVKKLGKPCTLRPRYVRGPAAHASR